MLQPPREGREIDRAGDGFLTCFASVSQAVSCAIAIQRALYRQNTSGTLPLEVAWAD